jgi:glycosyltransferase involved in cell wall biosynthesis
VISALLGGPFRFTISHLQWPLNSIDYYYKAYRIVVRDPVRPDIIHANDLDTLAVACLLKLRTGAKLVYDAQELYTGMHTLPRWYRTLMTIQEFLLVRCADRITIVNHAIAQEMERRYRIKVDEVILNCPPYEESPSRTSGSSVRDSQAIPESEPVYLFSGGLVKQRGIENTILALKHLPRGVLVILGEGQLKDRLLELIDGEGLGDRVRFADFVPHTEVPKFISSADIGILPYENVGINHYLCSPSKLFHYIMAELPVACSDFPFLRKVVLDDGLGAVFDPADPSSIARAIDTVLRDGQRYDDIKRNLVEARGRYCWENEEKKLLRVYSGLAH